MFNSDASFNIHPGHSTVHVVILSLPEALEREARNAGGFRGCKEL
jgi:hypothetical protein